jgi:RHS repeat-associated protein
VLSGVTTTYAWDTQAGVPLLLTDATNDYLYGPDGGVVEQVAKSGGTTSYLHPDRIGSVRVITNTAGASIGTASFDPYGNIITRTGTTTAYGYTGQYTDPTGLIYLRARYYDPATGQFLTIDPLVDSTRSPYGYVAGNPLNNTDPSGLDGGPAINPISGNFWTKGNIFSNPLQQHLACGDSLYSSLVSVYDPVSWTLPYYDQEVQNYENGGSYWSSVGYGLRGPAVVGVQLAITLATDGLLSGAGNLLGRLGSTTGEDVVPGVVRVPGDLKLPGVPKGATGVPVQSGKGLEYSIPRGTPELDPRVTRIRVMDPVTAGKYQYPHGYVVYMNDLGQTVNPLTGRVIPPSDPYAHIGLP